MYFVGLLLFAYFASGAYGMSHSSRGSFRSRAMRIDPGLPGVQQPAKLNFSRGVNPWLVNVPITKDKSTSSPSTPESRTPSSIRDTNQNGKMEGSRQTGLAGTKQGIFGDGEETPEMVEIASRILEFNMNSTNYSVVTIFLFPQFVVPVRVLVAYRPFDPDKELESPSSFASNWTEIISWIEGVPVIVHAIFDYTCDSEVCPFVVVYQESIMKGPESGNEEKQEDEDKRAKDKKAKNLKAALRGSGTTAFTGMLGAGMLMNMLNPMPMGMPGMMPGMGMPMMPMMG